jgi:hypothetical protein
MSGHTEPMSERTQDVGQGLIVGFPHEGNTVEMPNNETVDVYDAYFFRIAKAHRFYWHYDQLGDFSAGESYDYGFLGDSGQSDNAASPGNDILRIENDDFLVYHVGIGLETYDLRVYNKLGPAKQYREVDHDNQGQPDPTSDGNFGYYSGRQTRGDRYDPPAMTERLAFRNDNSGEIIQFGFRAESALTASETDLHIVGKTYELLPVLDDETQDKMLADVVGEVDEPDIPTIMVTEGDAVQTYRVGSSLPQDWDSLKGNGINRKLDFSDNGGE